MKRGIWSFTVLMFTGCVTTTVQPGAEQVRITTNQEAVHGCKFIGDVEGSEHMNGGVGAGAAEENAMRRLKNHAFEMHANIVLLVTSHTGQHGSDQRGEAYRCENPSK